MENFTLDDFLKCKSPEEKIKEEFGSVKALVMKILRDFPETRNSDNVLLCQICETLGMTKISELRDSPINIISIHKTRQRVQNTLGLYQAPKEVQELREERAEVIKDMMGKGEI